ncbi:BA71V-H359L (J1L) [Elysia marginata]|uniref:BA71V-H359L (J1L) n=1 Tax=Elysia marginata TaxID=1093978 RepID=A0AAV4GX05_9GAST|nr:BA71V-H359L (J1L) [Elysia marginata]
MMDTSRVKVRHIEITRENIDYGHKTAGAEVKAALAELMPGAEDLPLAKERIAIELEGVPTAVANALRRVFAGELRGHCLTFDGGDLDREATTDPFMADEDFIRTRLRMIPLRPQISETLVRDLRFTLDAKNHTDGVMAVYSGDLIIDKGSLSAPLFNPTHEIASLQPGRTLRIRNIRLTEGFGNQDAAFAVGARTSIRPLDLEEVPRKATHAEGGLYAKQSGFVQSSLVANPRRHLVTAYIPAVPAGGSFAATVVVDACGEIMKRLRYIQGVLESARARVTALSGQHTGASTYRAANAYFLETPEGVRTKGVLGIRNETDTIGNLLTRSVYELMPDIAFVGYTCVPHEKMMKLTVCHAVSEPGEIEPIVTRAVKHAYGIFSKIQQEVRAKV